MVNLLCDGNKDYVDWTRSEQQGEGGGGQGAMALWLLKWYLRDGRRSKDQREVD